MTLKVHRGIPEAYSEACQTSDAWVQYMKNLSEKMPITHLILDETWLLSTLCKVQALFFQL